jgi:hypothetical protein
LIFTYHSVAGPSGGTARKLSVEDPGALYHVMNPGDRGEPIFRDEEDRRRFLSTLGEACGKTDWQERGLCLMPNHFSCRVGVFDCRRCFRMSRILESPNSLQPSPVSGAAFHDSRIL